MTASRRRLRTLVFAATLLACAGCDHALKGAATGALAGGVRVSLLGDAVRLQLAHNPGAFLSAGAGLPEPLRGALFLGLVPLVILAVCLVVVRAGLASGPALLGLGLVAGGGLGNWIDRLAHGGLVTDFVSLGLGPVRTGVFNLADLHIVGGIALLLLSTRGRPSAAGPPGSTSSTTPEGANP